MIIYVPGTFFVSSCFGGFGEDEGGGEDDELGVAEGVREDEGFGDEVDDGEDETFGEEVGDSEAAGGGLKVIGRVAVPGNPRLFAEPPDPKPGTVLYGT